MLTESFGGQPFFIRITYAGGDGNDVVLRAVPEPGSWAAVLLCVLCAAALRRRPGSNHCARP